VKVCVEFTAISPLRDLLSANAHGGNSIRVNPSRLG